MRLLLDSCVWGGALDRLRSAGHEKLKEILGRYSVVMTERYAHLRPDLFSARDLAIIDLDLGATDPDPDPSEAETTNKMPEPPCKPGSKHCRYGSHPGATGSDKWADFFEATRRATTGGAARAPL